MLEDKKGASDNPDTPSMGGVYKWKYMPLLVGLVVAHPTGKGAGVEDEAVAAADIDQSLIDIIAPVLHGVPLEGVGVTLPQTRTLPELLESIPLLARIQYLTKRAGDIGFLA